MYVCLFEYVLLEAFAFYTLWNFLIPTSQADLLLEWLSEAHHA